MLGTPVSERGDRFEIKKNNLQMTALVSDSEKFC